MKTHIVLDIDCSALKAEIIALHEINSNTEVPLIWFGAPSVWPTIEVKLPSLQSTFNSLHANSDGVGYRTVNSTNTEAPMSIPKSHAILPLNNEPGIINFFTPNPLAHKIFDYFYRIEDCVKVESLAFDRPMLIAPNIPYTVIPTESSMKINFVLIRFNTTNINKVFEL